ncbi:BrnA antitoxin family protein [Aureimonas mangrovi]|uniref:BrnA antitoxin family protein n=1 Tax=Aureimonas mangrovi TaxID=2758041 RepID=UPI001FE5B6AE|nr:BrnA antitoxin family protein [Aureimonas mangrovi]
MFERADLYHGETLIRRGRPKVEHPKQRVTLRLDEDVVSALRASGRGWQTRVNQALREWIEKGAAAR